MRMLRTNTLRFLQPGFLLVLGVAALIPVGCRSTRSSLASLPGMGWVGPRDEAVRLGHWDDADSSSLPTPAEEATPQIASNGKPSAESSPRKSYPLHSKSDSASSVASSGARSDSVYPDTGYPPMEVSQKGTGKDRYVSDSTPQEGELTGDSVRVAPKRGFYGEEPGEKSDALADSDATSADDLRGEYPAGDEGGYSRFSDSEFGGDDLLASPEDTSDDSHAQTPSRWADNHSDPLDRGPTEFGASDSSLGQESDEVPESQFGDTPRETAGSDSQFANDAADLQGTVADDRFSEAADRWSGQRRQVSDDAVSTVQDRLGSTYQSAQQKLGSATRPLADAYNQAARQSEDLLQRGKATLNGFVGDREPDSELGQDSLNQVRDLAEQASSQADRAAEDLDIASPYNSDPSTDDQDRLRRVTQPWRPGSTSSYPLEHGEGRGAQRSSTTISPASYPADAGQGNRRLLPSHP